MTEGEIQEWLSRNTVECPIYHCKIKESVCKKRIKSMQKASLVTREQDVNCHKCPVYGGNKKEEQKKKGQKMSEATMTLINHSSQVARMTVDEIVEKWGFKRRQIYEACSRYNIPYRKVYSGR